MGSGIKVQGILFWVLYLASLSLIVVKTVNGESKGVTVKGIVVINESTVIGNIDNDFVCATLDWWPPEKCDYGRCSWGHASLFNLVFFFSFSSNANVFFNICCNLLIPHRLSN
ncbi:putative glycosidase [Lupinus albus]|uniref:Putative glycosidase n=1 Tax=Lupinus albus TaxID=3870 RepID=A0A6A4NCR5_LUPAL|nr:putative glycosidase [Lupinus albus]